MPARWVPLLYLAFAHICLATAFGELAVEPQSLAGFFYHPRMLAVVHLVTLGWISGSILGAIYLVGPLAFRMPLPAIPVDYLAFCGFAVGVVGMVTHFWIDAPGGLIWAAGLVACSMSYVAARVLNRLRGAPVPFEARLPMVLAFLNVTGAAGLGVLVAVNKVSPILKANHLDAVFAHAHLAALGWGTMMVVGAGYRILPMILPSAMPRGLWVYASAILLEGGIAGLLLGFFNGGQGLALSGVLAVAGILSFLSQVLWMLRHRRPGPTERRHPDWSVAHAMQALAYLIATCGIGLFLASSERSETTLALVFTYGVLGLVGFLSQIVVGVEGRLLPLFAWLWGFSDRAYVASPPSLHRVPVRSLQGLAFVLWTAGVPLLALGLSSNRNALVSLGAWALLIALLASLANTIVVIRRLWRL